MNFFENLPHIRNPEELSVYNKLRTVIWVFNIDNHSFWWANEPALKFWEVDSVEEFLSIDLSDDSPVVRERLNDIFLTGSTGDIVEENWTLYPGGNPKMVILTFTPILVGDLNRAVLIEASPELKEELDPRAKRILEAVRHTPLMISTFDLEGRLLAQNPAAANIYGSRSESMVTLENRYGDADIEEKIQPSADILVHTLMGKRWHTLTAEPGRDPVSGNRVIVITEEDVTKRVQAEEELRNLNMTLEQRVAERTEKLSYARKEAEDANAAKTDFLATMSHELRTPLNAIIGFSEMLSHKVYGPVTEKQLVALDDINRSGRHLLRQINELLDASTIDAGELNLFESTFSVASVMDYCNTIFQLEAAKKNQQLDIQVPDLSLKLHADEYRITQVIINLLTNAIKYTAENGTIRLSVFRNSIGELVFEVRDSGIGISKDHLSRVSQAFTQIDISSSSTSGKGVGLGLYIVSHLLTAHGGRLDIQSEERVGTVVHAILPIERLV